ncbi:MAG: hypothetical protein IKZ25_04835, partial [Clostridia bacterium]|nr:hypothetical protein [Clostridia bacterium]
DVIAIDAGDSISADMRLIESSSPALIGWCPFNETTWYDERNLEFRLIESVYKITKLYDKTRPCIDTSGWYHINKKEIHDVHDYEQDTAKFAENYSYINEGKVKKGSTQPYFGEPIYVSEYGGIKWAPKVDTGWGYGNAPKTLEEFIERYCTLADILISNPYILGLCYTQLYDVEQEQNGLYYYDRTFKFDDETMAKLKSAMRKQAEIEK